MTKVIKINLETPYGYDSDEYIKKHEIENVLECVKDKDACSIEAEKELVCLLIKNLYERGVNRIEIKLDEFNKYVAPPKEMTIEEIENILGHKIKIVKEK